MQAKRFLSYSTWKPHPASQDHGRKQKGQRQISLFIISVPQQVFEDSSWTGKRLVRIRGPERKGEKEGVGERE